MPPTVDKSLRQSGRALPLEILVVAARQDSAWPDPLPQWIAQAQVRLTCVRDFFEAAVMLRGETPWAALLVHPEGMMRRDFSMMSLIKRHVVLPLGSLTARTRHGSISDAGILPWEDTARALEQKLLTCYTPQNSEGSSAKDDSCVKLPIPTGVRPPSMPPRPHNPPAGTPENRMEIPVASRLADRYDELDGSPVLTENEIRALLGPVEQGSKD